MTTTYIPPVTEGKPLRIKNTNTAPYWEQARDTHGHLITRYNVIVNNKVKKVVSTPEKAATLVDELERKQLEKDFYSGAAVT